jgi:hypothetical protein|tara:strand:+ start:88 stop:1962 length:1875 start_codon:yes stop_codon:yes gene_type:complete
MDMKLNIRFSVCFLCVVLMAPKIYAQDLSGWSDKTLCRQLLNNPDNTDYVQEADSRGLDCGSSTQNSAQDDTQTSDNTKINVTNKPRGVLSSSKTKKQWNAYKRAKECFEHPTYAAGQGLKLRLRSGEEFAATGWQVPFNNSPISNEKINLRVAPKPFGKITLDEAYGEQNENVELARKWFSSAAQTLRLTNNKQTQDQFKSVLVAWATANALNKGLHVSWGAKPVDWHVMTSIGAILTSTALIADTLSSEERAIVGPWLNRLVAESSAGHWKDRADNKAYMRTYYTMIWAFMTGDKSAAQKAIDIYKLAIHDMRPDGSFPIDTQRGGMGVNYNNYTVSYLVMIAALVNKNTDQNLLDYTVDGRNIHTAVDFVVQSINEPSATNRLYAIPCPGGGDRWGSIESPNKKFIKQASYLMVYADMNPNTEHDSWIRDRYLSSGFIPQAINVVPNLLFHPLKVDPQLKEQLLSKLVDESALGVSSHQLATLVQPIACDFRLRRVVYENSEGGQLENWDMARGRMLLTNGGVKIEGNWLMGGLSTDPSYLKNEVNLKLTKTGHLVGEMAFFLLNVQQGDTPREPLYIELKPHTRSKPLNIINPKDAELWTDVEDWAGGVWQLTGCKEYTP